MKSILKLIRRFTITLIVSCLLLLTLNLALFIVSTYRSVSNAGGWTAAEEIGGMLVKNDAGIYELPEEGKNLLKERNAWAILIENGSGNVIWHSDDLPREIPLHYTAAELSAATIGYIADYPTTTGCQGDNLVILGHPKDMYWKMMKNTYDYQMIANVPKTFLKFLILNILSILAIYMVVSSGILRSVRPIINGIESLPAGQEVYLKEKGLLCDLATALNRTSEKIRMQERALKKKETARANWIAGVSHDIRTPLSMVMGYAGQLEENMELSLEDRKKAGIIRQQSVKMKNLVNDLNLASKLEYNMQPVRMEPVNLFVLTRRAVVDFMNLDMDGRYPVEWTSSEKSSDCMIKGDKSLLQRAVNNILTNAQVHNPDGCTICAKVRKDNSQVHILINDNGQGVTKDQLDKLQNTSHYMMSDGDSGEVRHGLGLLIVRQIAEVHHGSVMFGQGTNGGFTVHMIFPAA